MKAERNPPPQSREEALFNYSLTLPEDGRAGFLQRECASDAALRGRVEALLNAYRSSEGFLETPPQPAGVGGTVVIAPQVLEKAGDTIGRYKIREKLGEGGCGVVYVAEQAEPVRRRVALKIIKAGMDSRSVVARFEAERQALAMMDHPSIAKVLDAGVTGEGRPYFVMELVRGIKITEYCDQNNLSTEDRLRLFIQVCQAVQHAHQKGIIHRDIKPSNIMVTLHDQTPVPKVIDFGIAKAIEGRLTEETIYTQLYEFVGTPAYISPEQAEMTGLDIDTRSDIYSLGVLLYELLTGNTPFDAEALINSGLDGMRRTIREKEPPAPSTRLQAMAEKDLTTTAARRRTEAGRLVHAIKGDLDWIVMKAMEKDRTRRFETANAMAADLQRFLKDEPVEARPPSSIYRLQKLIRRNKATCAGIVGITGALLLGMVVSLNLYFKEKQALQQVVLAEAQTRKEMDARMEMQRKDQAYAVIGRKLSQAGVLMSDSKFSEAQDLMKQVPLIPQSAPIYEVLGTVYARYGKLDTAITNFATAATAQTTNAVFFDCLLPLLARQGRTQEFEQWRRTALERFTNGIDTATAQRLAIDCLILPASDAENREILTMLDSAVPGSPAPEGDLARGLSEYRQGQYEQAAARLERVADNQPTEETKKQARLIAAMARAKLGQPHPMATANENDPDLSEKNWREATVALVLAREAQQIK